MRFRFALPLLLAAVTLPTSASARTLEDYRHFRALAIDLLGRMPTRAEIATFEKPDFDLDHWIDQQLDEKGYVTRLTRVWMDTLRLELSPVIQIRPPSSVLRRVTITGPDGPTTVFFRPGQRRAREATDGEFCLTKSESGVQVPMNKPQIGEPIAVKKEVLEANTVLVKPWWLYRDYRASSPVLLYGQTWTTPDAGFEPVDDLLFEADGKTRVTAVRVCREEAITADNGTVYATGRKPDKGKPPFDRLRPLPLDDAWIKAHPNEPIACRSASAAFVSNNCGCGPGLERCMPWEGLKKNDQAFVSASRVALGLDVPFDRVEGSPSDWTKLWLSQEAQTFLGRLFREDRDFREVVTAKWTYVNGPLAQFYRSSSANTIGRLRAYGLLDDGEPLFSPTNVPKELLPHDLGNWERVESRSDKAAGLLTMPVFLEKYASRRARGAAVYSAFLCKSFVAADVKLEPSTEPDLTKRAGCSTCHSTLEPLAAWFSRATENDWQFLPESALPVKNPKCKLDAKGNAPGFCKTDYDPAFSTADFGMLRGAYASPAHADAGPAGLGAELAGTPEFATCAVERVTSAFLGRPLTSDDAALVTSLRDTFVKEGFRMRPLVRALVRTAAYRAANDLSSDTWREGAK
ncbi:MAG: DUF1585 domain-containing protein [Polyangiales bacterium]